MLNVIVFAATVSVLLRLSLANAGASVMRDGPPVLAVTAGSTTTSTDGTATTSHRLGLLRGVDPTVDMFYANEIDMSKEGLAWLDQRGLMWDVAMKDAKEMGVSVEEYIEKIKANFKKFAKSGIIHDREELLKYLDEIVSDDGTFALLLGGKSVGKSTILKSLAKVNDLSSKVLVLYIDARTSPGHLEAGLANGIVELVAHEVIKTREPIDWVSLLRMGVRSGIEIAIDSVLSILDLAGMRNETKQDVREILQLVADSVAHPASADSAGLSQSLLAKFMTLAETKFKFPVLIIDEANVVLGMENINGKPDNQTINILTNLVSYTKQDRRMNVIMASSEHAYPFRLEREGFDLRNVDTTIFAGEIPPKEMWKLLVTARYIDGDSKGEALIGMGPHLAELCLAAYGGHFRNVELAIKKMSLEKVRFEASLFLPNLKLNILRCLDTYSTSRPLLEDMAKYGFAHLEREDNPAAELISKENIGGVVTRIAACVIGISDSKWKGAMDESAVIPSSQCVRLRIAKVLLNKRPLLSYSMPNLFKRIRRYWGGSQRSKSEKDAK